MPTTKIASGGLNKIFILYTFSAWRNALSTLHQATLDSKPKLSNKGHVRNWKALVALNVVLPTFADRKDGARPVILDILRRDAGHPVRSEDYPC
jgi:hypothetical protein